MIKFNRRQTEAVASIFDNIATASIVALIIGTFIESKVPSLYALILVVVSTILIVAGLALRSGDK